MPAIIDSIIAHKFLIVSILFLFSEALSLIPGVKANGVFQALFALISKEKAAEDAAQK